MPAPKHDAIVQAIVALCLAAPALADGQVADETASDDMPEGVDAAIQVSMLDSQPATLAYQHVDWLTTVRVACKVRRDETGASGRPSTALGAEVYARVMGDLTRLGGLAETIGPPRFQPDVALLRTRIGVLNLDFPVRHRTLRASIA